MVSSMGACIGSLPVSSLRQQIRPGNDLSIEDPLSDALASPQRATSDLVDGVWEPVSLPVCAQALSGDAESFGDLPAGHQIGACSGEDPGVAPLAVGPPPLQ